MYAYLVEVQVTLLGGGTLWAVDVFEVETAQQAENAAKNIFLQAPEDQAIMYGDTAFFSGVIAAVESKALGILDLEQPFNRKWKDSLDLFDKMADEVNPDEAKHDGYFPDPTPNQR